MVNMNTKYVQMPQDDTAQIEQIVREYCSEPARGLAHGVQKDAIQNAFGARSVIKEKKAFETWAFYFELLKINGNDALSFWDEGTVGLTGDLLTADQITERISEGTLDKDQRLGRFLARLVSIRDIGPGVFGRGKLIFHGASTSTRILIDSKRNDGIYIALDRGVERKRLMQLEIPYCGDDARKFITEKSGGVLKPLRKTGTRITILDVNPEIVEAFKLSFASFPTMYDYRSLAHMIEETWWEIINFGAKIFMKYGNNILQVEVQEPLKTIIATGDGQDGIKVHQKLHVPITVDNHRYYIKKIRFVVMPSTIDEEYREIWIQRKRMKIGKVYRYLDINPQISRRLTGYITLEHDLEDIVEEAENTTHYGFNITRACTRHIRQVQQSELKEFESKMGLTPVSEDAVAKKRLFDSMREISEHAPELGLLTEQDTGIRKSDAEIIVRDFKLPNKDTLRIEFGDKVGPISYRVVSNSSSALVGEFIVETRQYGTTIQHLYKRKCNLEANANATISIPSFDISSDLYEGAKPIDIVAIYLDPDKKKTIASLSKRVYLGMDPPESPESPVEIALTCMFPRQNTRRVELSDVIRNIRIKVTNRTPHNIKVNVTSSVRHSENKMTGRPADPLFILSEEKSVAMAGQTDHITDISDVEITSEKFGSVLNTIISYSERTCEIFTVVRLAEDSSGLELPHQYTLDKASLRFYLQCDPPGHNIFKDTNCPDSPKDGRPSWYTGNTHSGYIFNLNIGHYSYRLIQSRHDEIILKQYGTVEMLKQAYLVAFANEVYKGPAEEHKDKLTSADLSVGEVVDIFDRIVGSALNRMEGG